MNLETLFLRPIFALNNNTPTPFLGEVKKAAWQEFISEDTHTVSYVTLQADLVPAMGLSDSQGLRHK